MATIFAIISALTLAIYTVVMTKKMGRLPYSISETFFTLTHKKWFGFCMIITGFTFMLSALDATPENWQFLAFLSFIGMLMIALAPNFTEKKEAVIHYIGTAVVLICTQAWVYVTHPWILILWLLPLVYIGRYIKRYGIEDIINVKPVFWLEITAFIVIYINLFMLIW